MNISTHRHKWTFVFVVTTVSILLSLFITSLTAPIGLSGGAILPAIAVPAIVAPLASYFAATLLLRINRLKLQAEQAKQEQARFFANMSHEIRTPINGIMGLTELLLETGLSADQQKYANTILQSSEALVDIINDILDHAKYQTEAVELETIPFSLRGLVEETVNLVLPLANKKGLALNVRFPAGPLDWIIGDPTRLRQVILNILGNAIKFTPKGKVVISVDYNQKQALPLSIAIADQGIGIAPEKIATIFDAFQQADSDTTRHFQGTGLGLSISQNLVKLMKGKISVASEHGLGSTFTLLLPLRPTTAQMSERAQGTDGPNGTAAAATEPLTEVRQEQFKDLKILIADDNKTNRTILHSMLQPTGADLSFCTDGQRALETFQAQPFDLLLLDMSMPILDGVAAAKAIRTVEASSGQKRVSIIALTANAQQQDKERCYAAGMDVFLVKPIRKADLLVGIKRALAVSVAKEHGENPL